MSSDCLDANSLSVICDNSTNMNIYNNKSCFIGNIEMDASLQVATIGSKQHVSAVIGTVRWKCKDDDGVFHTFEIQDVPYFPDFPVNILSVTESADKLDGDQKTGIDTKRNHAVLYWKRNPHRGTIYHPSSDLPEMPGNEGWPQFSLFFVAILIQGLFD